MTRTYGPILARADVSLTVRAGENGSGKSTLAWIAARSVQPHGGEVLIDREPVVLRSPRDALRAGIAIVAQEVTSIPDLSVAAIRQHRGQRRARHLDHDERRHEHRQLHLPEELTR